MGGHGSGRWYRYGTKAVCEGVTHYIDIRWLCREGLFKGSNVDVMLSWNSGNDIIGSVEIKPAAYEVRLRYSYRIGDGQLQPMQEFVSIDRTRCNYGGERLWFLCSNCGTRAAILYAAGIRFRCRRCYRLCYASQNEDQLSRMQRKQRKIRRRLGASTDISQAIRKKPKRMHWKTFERLRQREQEANYRADLAWVGQANKFLARFGG